MSLDVHLINQYVCICWCLLTIMSRLYDLHMRYFWYFKCKNIRYWFVSLENFLPKNSLYGSPCVGNRRQWHGVQIVILSRFFISFMNRSNWVLWVQVSSPSIGVIINISGLFWSMLNCILCRDSASETKTSNTRMMEKVISIIYVRKVSKFSHLMILIHRPRTTLLLCLKVNRIKMLTGTTFYSRIKSFEYTKQFFQF